MKNKTTKGLKHIRLRSSQTLSYFLNTCNYNFSLLGAKHFSIFSLTRCTYLSIMNHFWILDFNKTFLALFCNTETSIWWGEFQNSKREIGRYNMRSPGLSLKCMYRSIDKVRTSKGGEGSVQKRASIVLVISLLC